MTTSLLDVGAPEGGASIPHGVVSVHHLRLGCSTASCSCGWTGRRRRLMAAAEQDAWVHSMHEHCAVATPLVVG